MRPKGGIFKKKFRGKCFNCDKTGHKSADCNRPKKARGSEANMMEAVTRDVNDINLCAMVSELNMVDSNPKSWWLDTGATKHICAVRDMFTTFEPA